VPADGRQSDCRWLWSGWLWSTSAVTSA